MSLKLFITHFVAPPFSKKPQFRKKLIVQRKNSASKTETLLKRQMIISLKTGSFVTAACGRQREQQELSNGLKIRALFIM
jgi:hypothetical protein